MIHRLLCRAVETPDGPEKSKANGTNLCKADTIWTIREAPLEATRKQVLPASFIVWTDGEVVHTVCPAHLSRIQNFFAVRVGH